MIKFTIPSIITVNHYWGQGRNNRRFLTQRAKDFRFDVAEAVRKALLENPQPQMTGPLLIEIVYRWPDKRIRDGDNILKPLLDAIEHTGLIKNDNQFKSHLLDDYDFVAEFHDIKYTHELPKGSMHVEIYEFEQGVDGSWVIEWCPENLNRSYE